MHAARLAIPSSLCLPAATADPDLPGLAPLLPATAQLVARKLRLAVPALLALAHSYSQFLHVPTRGVEPPLTAS